MGASGQTTAQQRGGGVWPSTTTSTAADWRLKTWLQRNTTVVLPPAFGISGPDAPCGPERLPLARRRTIFQLKC